MRPKSARVWQSIVSVAVVAATLAEARLSPAESVHWPDPWATGHGQDGNRSSPSSKSQSDGGIGDSGTKWSDPWSTGDAGSREWNGDTRAGRRGRHRGGARSSDGDNINELSFTDDPFPAVIGATWSHGTAALKHLAISQETNSLPGIGESRATVNLPSRLGTIEALQIETRDGNRIASILMRFSTSVTSNCKSFGRALKNSASHKWTAWKMRSDHGSGMEIGAKWPGEEKLSAFCGPLQGALVRLDDAWTDLPTTGKEGGDNVAGELVWHLVTNDIAAARATNSLVTGNDVRYVTTKLLRRILRDIAALKTLSPRSLDAFEKFRAVAGFGGMDRNAVQARPGIASKLSEHP